MEQRNLILAIVISIAILVGFQFFFDQPKPPAPVPQTASSPAATVATSRIRVIRMAVSRRVVPHAAGIVCDCMPRTTTGSRVG